MNRRLTWAGAVLALVIGAGCGLVNKGSDDPGEPVPAGLPTTLTSPYADSSASSPPSPSPATSSPAPRSPSSPASPKSASPKSASSKSASSKSASPGPAEDEVAPTEDPNNFQAPACADYDGKAISKPKAKAALVAAAGKTYWPGSAPGLKLPKRLVLATAWHESGWQSNIVNCDGGHGLMQVMPDTEAFINQRFEKTYDAADAKQNAVLGANYLAWLTKAFGDDYFGGKYDLGTKKCRTHSSPCLLNMVIAGYNMGRGSVDEAYRADKSVPNPEYVDITRNLMADCYCDRY